MEDSKSIGKNLTLRFESSTGPFILERESMCGDIDLDDVVEINRDEAIRLLAELRSILGDPLLSEAQHMMNVLAVFADDASWDILANGSEIFIRDTNTTWGWEYAENAIRSMRHRTPE